MTKIDKSYLEKLGEVLYDEKKAINYKTVSILIGVHVNIAKQMLYHMYKTAKAEGKKIYATYYISGMAPRKVLMNLGKKNGEESSEESSSQQSPMDDLDAYLVSICRERDLEDIKAKYSKIFSIHMYSLSGFQIENYDALENLVEFPLRDSEGRTPVDFGPVMCSASQKLRPLQNGSNIRSAPVSNTVSKSKNEVFKVGEAKNQETGNGVSKITSGNGITKDSSKGDGAQESKTQQKPAKPAVTEKKDGNRLKSMFATASTKPKPQPKKVEAAKPEAKSEVNGKSRTEVHKNKNDEKSVQNRSKDKESSRKRKRIRDVLSSDSEEDAKMSEEDEDSAPESPVARKRIQIESDSDDDFKESPKKSEEPPVIVNDKITQKRKRVTKTISKSYVDKDGFLVTTKEQVMVSEDEDAEMETEDSTKASLNTLKNSVKEPASKKPAEQQPVKSNTTAKQNQGKTKQASLMSFFQKK